MLKRVVLELALPFSQEDGQGIERGESGSIRSIELLHLLRSGRNSYAAICRIELKKAGGDVKNLLDDDLLTEVQVVDREESGALIVYLKGKQPALLAGTVGPMARSAGVHMFDLFERREGKLKISFLGSATQMRGFLKRLHESDVRFKILSLTDARLSPDSPLYALTEKQRRILISAFRLGYFQVPRKITSEQLAEKFDKGSSTVSEHLRKAESRLISRILNES
jgi:hypothetical protein